MDAIYDEMYARNTTWLQTNAIVPDPLLLTPSLDSRKCIALVAQGEITDINMEQITNISVPLSYAWTIPKMHSTFIVLRGWNAKNLSNEDWTPLKSILSTISPYEIIFDRVIPVKTGLVLCGTPSININAIRDQIRAAGYETDVLYKCDIVHTTILRWTQEITPADQAVWLQQIMALPRKPYAKMTVTGFDIALASWSMQPGTTTLYDSIPLT